MSTQEQDSDDSQGPEDIFALRACGVVGFGITLLLAPIFFSVLEWQTSGSLSITLMQNLESAVLAAFCFFPVNMITALIRARAFRRMRSNPHLTPISSPVVACLLAGAGGLVFAMTYTEQGPEDWTGMFIGFAVLVFSGINGALWIAGELVLKRIISRGS